MLAAEFGNVAWRKSSYSGQGGDCIEVADGVTGLVPVRDSKDPEGPALAFSPEGWSSFVDFAKTFEV